MLEGRVDALLTFFMASIIRRQHSMVPVSKPRGHSLSELIHLVIQNEAFLTK